IGGTAKPGCSDNGPNYCHMDLTTAPDFSQALRDGLADVSGQILSCSYQLPEPPSNQTLDTSLINVIFTPSGSKEPKLIGRSTARDCKTGWRLENGTVTICPDTCAAIQEDPGASLELLFGCEAVDVPIR